MMEKKIYMKKSAKLFVKVIQPAAGEDLDAKDLDCGRSDGFSASHASHLCSLNWLKLADSKMQPGGLHDVHMCIPQS